VPVGVFANDQHRPSVKFDEELGEGIEPRPNSGAPTGQDRGSATLVAATTRDSAAAPEPPLQDPDPTIDLTRNGDSKTSKTPSNREIGGNHSSSGSTREHSRKIRQRLVASRGEPNRTASSRANSTDAV
jgi:hypothetical protein